jgi:hypothetical protein
MPNHHPKRLYKGKEYIIVKADNGKIYRGTYTKTKGILIGMKVGWYQHMFMYNDDFYDIDDIRLKATRARQMMEKRALDTILKRLVNETFEW